MRNLVLVQRRCISGKAELLDAHCLEIDFDTSRVYTSNHNALVCLDPATEEVEWKVDYKDHGFDLGSQGHEVVSIQHLPNQQSVCIAATNGDVLLYNIIPAELECVGSVENGICCMCWSPDQELVVLATAANTLLLMTKDFEPVLETALQPEEFGEQEPITVGWGKKETQFHGSEGKQAAVKRAEDVKPALPQDDRKVRISWRGDGECFVVSSINSVTAARQLRVWSRDCVLQYTSENVNGLEQALAWKPSGSLIVSSQSLPQRHDIVFFEKNGLRHGEFTLPFNTNEVKVCEALWNTESTILALWLEELPPENHSGEDFVPKSYVQLWTVGNYHWYLKQSLHFPATESERVTAVTFDPEHANQLHILTRGCNYLRLTWTWQTTCSRGLGEEDQAIAAVVDGKNVLVTPFKKMVVPPPMSAYTLQLPTFVNQVMLAPPPHSNNMAVVLQDGRIAFYMQGCDGDFPEDSSVKLVAAGGNGFKTRVSLPRLAGIARIMDKSGSPMTWDLPFHFYHFLWVKADRIVAVNYDNTNHVSKLYYIRCEGLGTEEIKLTCDQDIVLQSSEVLSVCSRGEVDSLAIQLDDGTVVDENDTFITKLPQRCCHMAVCSLGGEEVVVGLTERYRFYINDMEIASNCTSFAVTNEFLILTTHSHTCRCISLDTKLEDLQALSEGKAVTLDESVRRVERGSRIVTAIASDTRLVLQMPRGNLETIHPRALILSTIKGFLDATDYLGAFTTMRRHRINMNLIYDHNPQLFLNNVHTMVVQLNSSTSLNLFLMDLSEENVTTTMYAAAYRKPAPPSPFPDGSKKKVDVVCDAVMESLYSAGPNTYFLSVLTCHAKKTKPELEKALVKIKQLHGQAATNESDGPSADEALRYLLYLVDVNELFNVALGTYDFSLVVMVAEKSQKDPKEYLPFLNQLQSMEPDYQRYSIDKYLKRHVKALGHISRCPDHFSECQDLVQEHRLYPEALRLFERGSDQHKAIAKIYGEYLEEKNRYQEAALMYEMCDQLQMALNMCQKCGNWREVFCLALRLKFSAQDMTELARKIAAQLADNRQHSEAAVVLMEYANDLEEAITTLIEGSQWEEALRLMYKHNRTDFIETTLRPALIEDFENRTDSLSNFQSTFEHHKSRLAVVRETRLRQQQELAEGEGDFNEMDADLYSDASSVTGSVAASQAGSTTSSRSTLTAYTAYSEGRPRRQGRTNKTRRKGERKKNSLKEGSRNEDLALIEALALIIKNVDGMRDEVGVLLRMLMRFGYEEEARKLQEDLTTLISLIEKSVDEIWPFKSNEDQSTQAFGPHATANSIVASMTNAGGPQRTFKKDEIAILVPPKLSTNQKWKLHVLESR